MADFPLTRIGTPSFVPLLLTNARLASGGLPIEPVIFQSILLCLIAGNKHLILRTVEDDIGLVVKLAVKTLATVFVRDPTQIQLPDALVLSGLEHASLASQRALTEVLIERRVVIDDTDLSGVWPFPKDFILVYICPLDERERPPIHKPLLDKFALSATVLLHPTLKLCLRKSIPEFTFLRICIYILVSITAIKDASELSRAARVLGGDPTGMELISETLRSDARTDDNSTTGGETGDERFSKVLNDVESAFVVIDPQSTSTAFKDGPEDEVLASAVFGAAFSATSKKEERGRKRDRNRVTVKELLVEILQEV
ncbi:hypothetical protein LENED_012936 [Lentinula edodes]|uniref:Uncharacterized protein n=1 Tax=Lentinula edodes TaxID=5353 RepID=A0A1Q3ETU4_LENED|nr:hypothetical protein LENED_012936 [Lentinula edodes]